MSNGNSAKLQHPSNQTQLDAHTGKEGSASDVLPRQDSGLLFDLELDLDLDVNFDLDLRKQRFAEERDEFGCNNSSLDESHDPRNQRLSTCPLPAHPNDGGDEVMFSRGRSGRRSLVSQLSGFSSVHAGGQLWTEEDMPVFVGSRHIQPLFSANMPVPELMSNNGLNKPMLGTLHSEFDSRQSLQPWRPASNAENVWPPGSPQQTQGRLTDDQPNLGVRMRHRSEPPRLRLPQDQKNQEEAGEVHTGLLSLARKFGIPEKTSHTVGDNLSRPACEALSPECPPAEKPRTTRSNSFKKKRKLSPKEKYKIKKEHKHKAKTKNDDNIGKARNNKEADTQEHKAPNSSYRNERNAPGDDSSTKQNAGDQPCFKGFSPGKRDKTPFKRTAKTFPEMRAAKPVTQEEVKQEQNDQEHMVPANQKEGEAPCFTGYPPPPCKDKTAFKTTTKPWVSSKKPGKDVSPKPSWSAESRKKAGKAASKESLAKKTTSKQSSPPRTSNQRKAGGSGERATPPSYPSYSPPRNRPSSSPSKTNTKPPQSPGRGKKSPHKDGRGRSASPGSKARPCNSATKNKRSPSPSPKGRPHQGKTTAVEKACPPSYSPYCERAAGKSSSHDMRLDKRRPASPKTCNSVTGSRSSTNGRGQSPPLKKDASWGSLKETAMPPYPSFMPTFYEDNRAAPSSTRINSQQQQQQSPAGWQNALSPTPTRTDGVQGKMSNTNVARSPSNAHNPSPTAKKGKGKNGSSKNGKKGKRSKKDRKDKNENKQHKSGKKRGSKRDHSFDSDRCVPPFNPCSRSPHADDGAAGSGQLTARKDEVVPRSRSGERALRLYQKCEERGAQCSPRCTIKVTQPCRRRCGQSLPRPGMFGRIGQAFGDQLRSIARNSRFNFPGITPLYVPDVGRQEWFMYPDAQQTSGAPQETSSIFGGNSKSGTSGVGGSSRSASLMGGRRASSPGGAEPLEDTLNSESRMSGRGSRRESVKSPGGRGSRDERAGRPGELMAYSPRQSGQEATDIEEEVREILEQGIHEDDAGSQHTEESEEEESSGEEDSEGHGSRRSKKDVDKRSEMAQESETQCYRMRATVRKNKDSVEVDLEECTGAVCSSRRAFQDRRAENHQRRRIGRRRSQSRERDGSSRGVRHDGGGGGGGSRSSRRRSASRHSISSKSSRKRSGMNMDDSSPRHHGSASSYQTRDGTQSDGRRKRRAEDDGTDEEYSDDITPKVMSSGNKYQRTQPKDESRYSRDDGRDYKRLETDSDAYSTTREDSGKMRDEERRREVGCNKKCNRVVVSSDTSDDGGRVKVKCLGDGGKEQNCRLLSTGRRQGREKKNRDDERITEDDMECEEYMCGENSLVRVCTNDSWRDQRGQKPRADEVSSGQDHSAPPSYGSNRSASNIRSPDMPPTSPARVMSPISEARTRSPAFHRSPSDSCMGRRVIPGGGRREPGTNAKRLYSASSPKIAEFSDKDRYPRRHVRDELGGRSPAHRRSAANSPKSKCSITNRTEANNYKTLRSREKSPAEVYESQCDGDNQLARIKGRMKFRSIDGGAADNKRTSESRSTAVGIQNGTLKVAASPKDVKIIRCDPLERSAREKSGGEGIHSLLPTRMETYMESMDDSPEFFVERPNPGPESMARYKRDSQYIKLRQMRLAQYEQSLQPPDPASFTPKSEYLNRPERRRQQLIAAPLVQGDQVSPGRQRNKPRLLSNGVATQQELMDQFNRIITPEQAVRLAKTRSIVSTDSDQPRHHRETVMQTNNSHTHDDGRASRIVEVAVPPRPQSPSITERTDQAAKTHGAALGAAEEDRFQTPPSRNCEDFLRSHRPRGQTYNYLSCKAPGNFQENSNITDYITSPGKGNGKQDKERSHAIAMPRKDLDGTYDVSHGSRQPPHNSDNACTTKQSLRYDGVSVESRPVLKEIRTSLGGEIAPVLGERSSIGRYLTKTKTESPVKKHNSDKSYYFDAEARSTLKGTFVRSPGSDKYEENNNENYPPARSSIVSPGAGNQRLSSYSLSREAHQKARNGSTSARTYTMTSGTCLREKLQVPTEGASSPERYLYHGDDVPWLPRDTNQSSNADGDRNASAVEGEVGSELGAIDTLRLQNGAADSSPPPSPTPSPTPLLAPILAPQLPPPLSSEAGPSRAAGVEASLSRVRTSLRCNPRLAASVPRLKKYFPGSESEMSMSTTESDDDHLIHVAKSLPAIVAESQPNGHVFDRIRNNSLQALVFAASMSNLTAPKKSRSVETKGSGMNSRGEAPKLRRSSTDRKESENARGWHDARRSSTFIKNPRLVGMESGERVTGGLKRAGNKSVCHQSVVLSETPGKMVVDSATSYHDMTNQDRKPSLSLTDACKLIKDAIMTSQDMTSPITGLVILDKSGSAEGVDAGQSSQAAYTSVARGLDSGDAVKLCTEGDQEFWLLPADILKKLSILPGQERPTGVSSVPMSCQGSQTEKCRKEWYVPPAHNVNRSNSSPVRRYNHPENGDTSSTHSGSRDRMKTSWSLNVYSLGKGCEKTSSQDASCPADSPPSRADASNQTVSSDLLAASHPCYYLRFEDFLQNANTSNVSPPRPGGGYSISEDSHTNSKSGREQQTMVQSSISDLPVEYAIRVRKNGSKKKRSRSACRSVNLDKRETDEEQRKGRGDTVRATERKDAKFGKEPKGSSVDPCVTATKISQHKQRSSVDPPCYHNSLSDETSSHGQDQSRKSEDRGVQTRECGDWVGTDLDAAMFNYLNKGRENSNKRWDLDQDDCSSNTEGMSQCEDRPTRSRSRRSRKTIHHCASPAPSPSEQGSRVKSCDSSRHERRSVSKSRGSEVKGTLSLVSSETLVSGEESPRPQPSIVVVSLSNKACNSAAKNCVVPIEQSSILLDWLKTVVPSSLLSDQGHDEIIFRAHAHSRKRGSSEPRRYRHHQTRSHMRACSVGASDISSNAITTPDLSVDGHSPQIYQISPRSHDSKGRAQQGKRQKNTEEGSLGKKERKKEKGSPGRIERQCALGSSVRLESHKDKRSPMRRLSSSRASKQTDVTSRQASVNSPIINMPPLVHRAAKGASPDPKTQQSRSRADDSRSPSKQKSGVRVVRPGGIYNLSEFRRPRAPSSSRSCTDRRRDDGSGKGSVAQRCHTVSSETSILTAAKETFVVDASSQEEKNEDFSSNRLRQLDELTLSESSSYHSDKDKNGEALRQRFERLKADVETLYIRDGDPPPREATSTFNEEFFEEPTEINFNHVSTKFNPSSSAHEEAVMSLVRRKNVNMHFGSQFLREFQWEEKPEFMSREANLLRQYAQEFGDSRRFSSYSNLSSPYVSDRDWTGMGLGMRQWRAGGEASLSYQRGLETRLDLYPGKTSLAVRRSGGLQSGLWGNESNNRLGAWGGDTCRSGQVKADWELSRNMLGLNMNDINNNYTGYSANSSNSNTNSNNNNNDDDNDDDDDSSSKSSCDDDFLEFEADDGSGGAVASQSGPGRLSTDLSLTSGGQSDVRAKVMFSETNNQRGLIPRQVLMDQLARGTGKMADQRCVCHGCRCHSNNFQASSGQDAFTPRLPVFASRNVNGSGNLTGKEQQGVGGVVTFGTTAMHDNSRASDEEFTSAIEHLAGGNRQWGHEVKDTCNHQHSNSFYRAGGVSRDDCLMRMEEDLATLGKPYRLQHGGAAGGANPDPGERVTSRKELWKRVGADADHLTMQDATSRLLTNNLRNYRGQGDNSQKSVMTQWYQERPDIRTGFNRDLEIDGKASGLSECGLNQLLRSKSYETAGAGGGSVGVVGRRHKVEDEDDDEDDGDDEEFEEAVDDDDDDVEESEDDDEEEEDVDEGDDEGNDDANHNRQDPGKLDAEVGAGHAVVEIPGKHAGDMADTKVATISRGRFAAADALPRQEEAGGRGTEEVKEDVKMSEGSRSNARQKKYPIDQMKVPVIEKERVRFACDENGDWAEIGRGSYGCVYLGLLDGSIEVAIKDFYEASSWELVIHEARMLMYLQETGITPRLYGLRRRFDVTKQPSEYCIIMEYFGDGRTLFNVMSDKIALRTDEWLDIVGQLVAGLRLIHRKGVLINDLKADNILVDLTKGRKVIRYIDVGMATYKQGLTFQLPEDQMNRYNFLAPEVREGGRTTTRSDIYSLGYMLEQMCRLADSALGGLRKLVSRCMDKRAGRRPDLDDIVSQVHRYIGARAGRGSTSISPREHPLLNNSV